MGKGVNGKSAVRREDGETERRRNGEAEKWRGGGGAGLKNVAKTGIEVIENEGGIRQPPLVRWAVTAASTSTSTEASTEAAIEAATATETETATEMEGASIHVFIWFIDSTPSLNPSIHRPIFTIRPCSRRPATRTTHRAPRIA
jgi:hypothetical protein